MEFKHAPGLVIGLSLSFAYFLGCATHQFTEATPASAQLAQRQAAPARWAYHCIEGNNAEAISQRANALGQQGWAMVAGVGGGNGRLQGLWCFKRAL